MRTSSNGKPRSHRSVLVSLAVALGVAFGSDGVASAGERIELERHDDQLVDGHVHAGGSAGREGSVPLGEPAK